MALNLDTQDLENYPGTTKRVTVDVDSLVPYGYEGDEQIVLTVSTTAYSDNVNRTAIQDLYITEAKSGWLKSSGFKGSVFPLDTTANKLRISLDTTVSGWLGDGWYHITLEDDGGNNIPGDDVADDLEAKIRALPDGGQWNAADDGFILAYKNCSVDFENGKFKITSGSVGESYIGTDRTSVAVTSGTSDDCYELLGFDLPVSSYSLAGQQIREGELTEDYPYMGSDYTKLYISTGTGIVEGDALAITDGTNTDYFMAGVIGAGGLVNVISGSIGYSFSANKAKIQILRMQDPEGEPTSPYESMDALARHGIKHMINQIDYSS
jgi:hypothetical protein